LDKYYKSIEDYTFKTKFVKFSKEEGQSWLRRARGVELTESDKTNLSKLKSVRNILKSG